MPGPRPVPLVIAPELRAELVRVTRSTSARHGNVVRACIVLLCADGAKCAFDDEGRSRSPPDLHPGLDRKCDIGSNHDRSDENEGRAALGPGRVLLDPS